MSKENTKWKKKCKSPLFRYKCKMPRQLSYLEETIKKEISSKVKRER